MTEKIPKQNLQDLPIDGEFDRKKKLRLRSREEGAQPTEPLFEMPSPEMAMPEMASKKKTIFDDWDDLRERRDKLDSGSNLRALLVGATPLLAGFLGGSMGDAAEIAGKALIQEDVRRQGEDKTLLEMLKFQSTQDARGGGRAENGTRSEPNENVFVRATGKWHTVPRSLSQIPDIDPAEFSRYPEAPKKEDIATEADRVGTIEGRKIDERKKAGVYEVAVEGAQGQPMVRTKGSLEARPVNTGTAPGEILSTKHHAQIQQVRAGYEKAVVNDKKILQDVDSYRSSIAANSPLGDQFALQKLARLAQGGGVLTDRDVDRNGGSQAIDRLIQRYQERAKSGRLTKPDLDDMNKLVNTIDERLKTRVGNTRKAHLSSGSKMTKMKYEDLDKMVPADIYGSKAPKDDTPKPPEKMTSEERSAELERLRKAVGK